MSLSSLYSLREGIAEGSMSAKQQLSILDAYLAGRGTPASAGNKRPVGALVSAFQKAAPAAAAAAAYSKKARAPSYVLQPGTVAAAAAAIAAKGQQQQQVPSAVRTKVIGYMGMGMKNTDIARMTQLTVAQVAQIVSEEGLFAMPPAAAAAAAAVPLLRQSTKLLAPVDPRAYAALEAKYKADVDARKLAALEKKLPIETARAAVAEMAKRGASDVVRGGDVTDELRKVRGGDVTDELRKAAQEAGEGGIDEFAEENDESGAGEFDHTGEDEYYTTAYIEVMKNAGIDDAVASRYAWIDEWARHGHTPDLVDMLVTLEYDDDELRAYLDILERDDLIDSVIEACTVPRKGRGNNAIDPDWTKLVDRVIKLEPFTDVPMPDDDFPLDEKYEGEPYGDTMIGYINTKGAEGMDPHALALMIALCLPEGKAWSEAKIGRYFKRERRTDRVNAGGRDYDSSDEEDENMDLDNIAVVRVPIRGGHGKSAAALGFNLGARLRI